MVRFVARFMTEAVLFTTLVIEVQPTYSSISQEVPCALH